MLNPVTRYTLVGAIGTAAHYATFSILVLAEFSAPVSTATGAGIGAGINYTLCRWWVFTEKGTHIGPEVFRFAVVAIISMGFNATVMLLLAPHVGIWVSQLIASALTLILGFSLNQIWTFRVSQSQIV